MYIGNTGIQSPGNFLRAIRATIQMVVSYNLGDFHKDSKAGKIY
jgi:hypothetical protein